MTASAPVLRWSRSLARRRLLRLLGVVLLDVGLVGVVCLGGSGEGSGPVGGPGGQLHDGRGRRQGVGERGRDAVRVDRRHRPAGADRRLLLARLQVEGVLDGDDLPAIIASYNGGPHNVSRWMRQIKGTVTLAEFVEHIPWSETRNYVKLVTGSYARYAELYGPENAALALPGPPDADDPTVINF